MDESNALAEPPLNRALALDDQLGEAHATLGLLRQQQGSFPAAEESYKRAIELQPNYARVFRLYGRLRWREGRNADAMALSSRLGRLRRCALLGGGTGDSLCARWFGRLRGTVSKISGRWPRFDAPVHRAERIGGRPCGSPHRSEPGD